MFDKRFVTLLGSDVLFAVLSLLLVLRPEQAAVIFPFYGLLFLWTHFRGESEIPVIFSFLVGFVGLVLAARAPVPADQGAFLIETAGLVSLNFALGLHRTDALREQRVRQAERYALEAGIRDDQRDLDYYRSYQASAGTQIRLRRDLTESAKSLGNTMNAGEVHSRLVGILSTRYPGARVQVLAGAPADPLVDAAAKRKGPVLVRDSSIDERFSGGAFRCGMAVPIKVNRQPAGYLTLEADKPSAFGPEDVKTVDLFATLASLSLENIQLYEQIHEQATHDPLTQLFSHKAFQQRLQEELLRSGRSQTPLSFILCDVDHFKHYNDRYGHQAGDHLLRTLAAILSSFARPVDFAARYGGEEFCLILPNFVRSEAVDLANRLRLRVESEPFVFQGHNTRATLSLGVSSFPQDATSPSQMIRVADERMYRAKSGGRNQVVG
ncbi:MAG: sensor domain-containing diguanylate cyclase [Elusimicrobiota bacterium]